MSRAWGGLFAVLGLLAPAVALAGSSGAAYCDADQHPDARQQDRLLRMAALVRRELDASGATVALVARTGIDVSRFGISYSHEGIALKANPNAPWSVRQLFYACTERRPRLYDQGLAGFALGADVNDLGHLAVVFLPDEPAQALERVALDDAYARDALAGVYSANAYAFSTKYQNCNQWVAEMLATAWGALPKGDDLRARAQQWLLEQSYEPQPVAVRPSLLMLLVPFIPWVREDDHPHDDLAVPRFRISTPAAVEGFVQRRYPQARRVEFCHDAHRLVVHRGWTPVEQGCRPGPADRVIDLDRDEDDTVDPDPRAEGPGLLPASPM